MSKSRAKSTGRKIKSKSEESVFVWSHSNSPCLFVRRDELSDQAKLQFSVRETAAQIKKKAPLDSCNNSDVGLKYGGSPIFLAGVLEYISAEVLELAGNMLDEDLNLASAQSVEPQHIFILPSHVDHAIENDEDLNYLFKKI